MFLKSLLTLPQPRGPMCTASLAIFNRWGLARSKNAFARQREKLNRPGAPALGTASHAGVDHVDSFIRRQLGDFLRRRRPNRAVQQDQRAGRRAFQDAIVAEHAFQHFLIGAYDHVDERAGLRDGFRRRCGFSAFRAGRVQSSGRDVKGGSDHVGQFQIATKSALPIAPSSDKADFSMSRFLLTVYLQLRHDVLGK